jgi:hypothetical protein
MRIAGLHHLLSAAAILSLLAGCTNIGVSSNPQRPESFQGRHLFRYGAAPSALHQQFESRFAGVRPQRVAGHFNCPFSGAFEYVSDEFNNAIDVYTGKFAGQAPCGLLASPLLAGPSGIHVDPVTHDLYVANWGAANILVFHKGATTPYNTYTDPTGQNPDDVTLAKDGTVIASNEESTNGKERGSISTWKSGPGGGTFVGNFPMTDDDFGLFLTLAKNGKVFFNDVDSRTGIGALWKVSCPLGACGIQAQVPGVTFADPGDLVFDDAGNLLANDLLRSAVDIFELPNPQPSTIALPCCPLGIAFDALHQHWFTTSYTYAAEYAYPSFAPIGNVPSQNGAMFGVAVDP